MNLREALSHGARLVQTAKATMLSKTMSGAAHGIAAGQSSCAAFLRGGNRCADSTQDLSRISSASKCWVKTAVCCVKVEV